MDEQQVMIWFRVDVLDKITRAGKRSWKPQLSRGKPRRFETQGAAEHAAWKLFARPSSSVSTRIVRVLEEVVSRWPRR